MMLDGLSIGGIRPIDDKASRRNNRRNRKRGKKFTLNGEVEDETPDSRKTDEKRENKMKEPKEPVPEREGKNGGIDIII